MRSIHLRFAIEYMEKKRVNIVKSNKHISEVEHACVVIQQIIDRLQLELVSRNMLTNKENKEIESLEIDVLDN